MFDLHCHLLPGIDDGATDLDTALAMARVAVADGIQAVVCTPHIYPGLYDNDAAAIGVAVARMQAELDARGIALRLHAGADVHLAPGLVEGVRAGRIPTLAGSRYLLLEPPHHVPSPRLEAAVLDLLTAGITPVITHPERLGWVGTHYALFERMADRGAWMQVTGGSLTGCFGPRVKYWAERFVGDGLCRVLATDAHHPTRRPPVLAGARAAAAALVGDEVADAMVRTRPAGVIANAAPASLAPAMAPGTAWPGPGRVVERVLGYLRRA